MYLVNYRLNRLKNALYSILLLYLLSQFLVVADVLSLVKHQFQCVSHVGYNCVCIRNSIVILGAICHSVGRARKAYVKNCMMLIFHISADITAQ